MLRIHCILYVRIAASRLFVTLTHSQIGFLTQWQLYAQQIEGDSWRDASLDQVTFEKLNGNDTVCAEMICGD